MYTSIIFFQQSITNGTSNGVHLTSHSSYHTRLIYTHHHHHHHVLCAASHVPYTCRGRYSMSILIMFKLSSEFTDSLEYRKYYCNVKIAQHPSIHPSIQLSINELISRTINDIILHHSKKWCIVRPVHHLTRLIYIIMYG